MMLRLSPTLGLLFLLVLAPAAYAQDDDMPPPPLSEERLREIRAQKSAYITQRIDLTPEESQAFWPLYNAYDKELEAVRKPMMDARREAKRDAALSEADAARILDEQLAHKQAELDLRRKYNTEFKKVIGARRTLELARAEHGFNRELFRRMRPPGEHKDAPPPRKR